jgi:hypothetical protein
LGFNLFQTHACVTGEINLLLREESGAFEEHDHGQAD